MASSLLDKIKDNKSFLAAAATFTIAQAVDATCTGIGLSNNDVTEGNKFVQEYINQYGIVGRLATAKIVMTTPILTIAAAGNTYLKNKTHSISKVLYGGAAYSVLAGSSWIPIKYAIENWHTISSTIEKILN